MSAFPPQAQNIEGRPVADLAVGGTAGRPVVSGRVSLEADAPDLPAAGIRLEALTLTAAGDGSGPLTINGHAESGDGHVDHSGSADLAPLVLDLEIQGERFQAAATHRSRPWSPRAWRSG